MICAVYLAIKNDAYDETTIKVFQEREDAVNQLKAWIAEEFLALQHDYSKFKKEKQNEDAKNCVEWATDVFKEMKVEENKGEIFAVSWTDMYMEIQEKEIN